MEHRTLLKQIDRLAPAFLDVLEAVCNIESPTGYKEGVDAAVAYLVSLAERRGWAVEVCPEEGAGSPACLTLCPDAEGTPVCLSGHMDTVHPVGSFGTPATRRDATRMYGPGVVDCKGGVVAGMLAMAALEEVGFCARPVRLILQTDEETGSTTSGGHTLRYMCDKARDAEAFLNLEGYRPGQAVIWRKGILRLKLTVHGRAAHSARCVEGRSAVAEAAYKIIELESWKDPDGLTCNCGVIHGGTVGNTVAETCTFVADIRFATAEECALARERIDRIAHTSTVEGCTCTVEQMGYRPPMEPSVKNDRLVEQMNRIYDRWGLPLLRPSKSLGGSDAAYITELGVPCVDSLGTEGNYIHSTEEYMELRSLAESAKRIATVVVSL